MSQFGSSSNTSKGFNEIKSPGGNGVSMDTAKSMTTGTNTPVSQGEPKGKKISTGQNNPTNTSKSTTKEANISKMNSMDKSGFGGKTSRPL